MGCSVIDILIVHAAHGQCSSLRNRQLTAVCRSNYVELTGINRTHSALGEFDKILVRICLGSGCGDTLEGHTIGRSGIAADGLLRTIVGVCARVGLKGHILIIVNDDLIVAGADLAGLGNRGNGSIPINGDWRFANCGTIFLIVNFLGGLNVLAIPLVAHRIAQIASDRPAASQFHIVCWHLEGGNNFVVQLPTIEGIAIHRGRVGNLHGGFHCLFRCSRELGCSSGSISSISVGHIELVGLPDGIQNIGAFLIHQHLFACGIVNRPAGGSAPAQELIAITFERTRALQGYDGIVDRFNDHGIFRTMSGAACGIVGMVGQGRACGSIAPDGVQGDVGVMDGNLVAGLIDGAAAYLGAPTQEHLVLGGNQVGSLHDIRVGTVGIGLAVHRYGAAAAVGIISNGEGQVAGVVGVKGNIAANFRIEVEGGVDIVGSSSAPHSPVSPGVAIGNSDRGEILLVDLGAIGDLDGLRAIALYGQIGSSGNGRRSPLGVEHQVAAGHGSAGPVELGASRAALGGVPAGERIGFRDSRGPVGRIVLTADIRFVVDILDDFLVVAVDEG